MKIFWYTSLLKSTLTNDQFITHTEYSLWKQENNGNCYSEMLDHVHVDEK